VNLTRAAGAGPNGDLWTYGKPDATDTITGPAGQWCRLAVQRITRADAPDLVANELVHNSVLEAFLWGLAFRPGRLSGLSCPWSPMPCLC
jgi:hypothetical protein